MARGKKVTTDNTDGNTRTTASPPKDGNPGPDRASSLSKMKGFKQAKDITSVMVMKQNKVRQEYEPFKQPFQPHGEDP